MAKHQHDGNASELWEYFQAVIEWVRGTFTAYRGEMEGVNWGELYNRFKAEGLDAAKLETEIAELMEEEDVTKKAGIYPYVLTREEKLLSIRAFPPKTKRETYEKQNHRCAKCEQGFALKQMEADHIEPWSEGGRTIPKNCQMLCKKCHKAS